jgi:hypothetical protein
VRGPAGPASEPPDRRFGGTAAEHSAWRRLYARSTSGAPRASSSGAGRLSTALIVALAGALAIFAGVWDLSPEARLVGAVATAVIAATAAIRLAPRGASRRQVAALLILALLALALAVALFALG